MSSIWCPWTLIDATARSTRDTTSPMPRLPDECRCPLCTRVDRRTKPGGRGRGVRLVLALLASRGHRHPARTRGSRTSFEQCFFRKVEIVGGIRGTRGGRVVDIMTEICFHRGRAEDGVRYSSGWAEPIFRRSEDFLTDRSDPSSSIPCYARTEQGHFAVASDFLLPSRLNGQLGCFIFRR